MLHFWMGLYDNVPGVARVMHILFGPSFEAPVRGLAMIFGTAGIPAIYALGRRVGGISLGVISAALLTVNPFDLWYSQDAKMYTLLVLMTLVTTLLYLYALERNTRLLWVSYVLATWVMLTSHSLSGLVLLAQMVATPFLLRGIARNATVTGTHAVEGANAQFRIRAPDTLVRDHHGAYPANHLAEGSSGPDGHYRHGQLVRERVVGGDTAHDIREVRGQPGCGHAIGSIQRLVHSG